MSGPDSEPRAGRARVRRARLRRVAYPMRLWDASAPPAAKVAAPGFATITTGLEPKRARAAGDPEGVPAAANLLSPSGYGH